MPQPNNLYVTDIALLYTIKENPNCTKDLLWQPKAKGLWNRFLQSSGLIRRGHCALVRAQPRFIAAISTLRFCGYLREDVAHYQISDVGSHLFYSLSFHPIDWPLVVPLDESGKRLWENAQYFEAK